MSQRCALAAKRTDSILGSFRARLDTAAGFDALSTGKTLINWNEFSKGPPRWLGAGAAAV